MKKCSKCKNTKEFYEFEKRKDSKDGYRAQCKKCHIRSTKEWGKQYRKRNKKRLLENYKIYYRKNKIKKIKYSSKWRTENRERYNELKRSNKIKTQIPDGMEDEQKI